jgi:hypothetical protein
MVQRIQTFHDSLLDLAVEIKQSLYLVATIQDFAKIEYLKDTIVKIIMVASNAVAFIQKHLGKSLPGKLYGV